MLPPEEEEQGVELQDLRPIGERTREEDDDEDEHPRRLRDLPGFGNALQKTMLFKGVWGSGVAAGAPVPQSELLRMERRNFSLLDILWNI